MKKVIEKVCVWGNHRNVDKQEPKVDQAKKLALFVTLTYYMKTEANVWENSGADQWNPRRSQGFSPAPEFSQTLPRFSTGYGGTVNMFYFFYKIIIFIVNKEKDDIRSAYGKFSELGDSHITLLTSFSCFIAL